MELMNQNLQAFVHAAREKISLVHPVLIWGLNNGVQANHREIKYGTTTIDCSLVDRIASVYDS
jgi:hypothetical protein